MVEPKSKKETSKITYPKVQESGMVNHTVTDPGFTGLARSVICKVNQGHNQFQILTLYIESGKVLKMDVSDIYAQWEAIALLEKANDLSVVNLNNNWKEGRALIK